jgi:hypothetical protein
VRREGEIICKTVIRGQGSRTEGFAHEVHDSQILKRDLEHPPAHRDKAAMNGAQLLKAHGDSSGLMNGSPAGGANCPAGHLIWVPDFSPTITDVSPQGDISCIIVAPIEFGKNREQENNKVQ